MNDTFAGIVRRHLRHLDPEDGLHPATSLREAGLDSLQAVSLVLELEDEFDVMLPDTSMTAETFETPSALWAAFAAAGAGQPADPVAGS